MRTSENRLTRERNLIVISAWAGIVGAILLNVVPTVTGLFTPGYSTSSQTINDLGIGPTAWIVNTIQFIVGVLFATFAVGFRKAIGPVINRKLTKTTALLFLSGVGRLLIAVFTVDGPWTPGKLGTPTSLHGILNIDAILFSNRINLHHRTKPLESLCLARIRLVLYRYRPRRFGAFHPHNHLIGSVWAIHRPLRTGTDSCPDKLVRRDGSAAPEV